MLKKYDHFFWDWKMCHQSTLQYIFSQCVLFTGIAGCCAKSTVAPFDRVKILLQAHSQHYRHLGELQFCLSP